MSMIAFRRTALAQQLASDLQGFNPFSDAHNGLFLAAPRRTGKSTFLQSDLRPALENSGVVVVYVDLWADVRKDPGALISEAIGNALEPHLGFIARSAKKMGLTKVTVANALEVDTSQIGASDGLTLANALQLLHETSEKPVALIIDEAQHSLVSEAGEAAMTALKSARDQMNQPGSIKLMLVMSGSDRDKLLRLVNTSSAPFYGSQISRMPHLDQDFIDHIAALIENQRTDLKPVNKVLLAKAFEGFGYRPQFFMAALGSVLSPLAEYKGRFEDALIFAAQKRKEEDEAQMESDYLGLKPIEQAVLWRMMELGQNYRAYDGNAIHFYKEKTKSKVTAAQVQKALDALRDRTPALVWKSARGEYSLEDAAMYRWFEHRKATSCWPPVGIQQALNLGDF